MMMMNSTFWGPGRGGESCWNVRERFTGREPWKPHFPLLPLPPPPMQCIRAPSRRGRYWEIHPRRPRFSETRLISRGRRGYISQLHGMLLINSMAGMKRAEQMSEKLEFAQGPTRFRTNFRIIDGIIIEQLTESLSNKYPCAKSGKQFLQKAEAVLDPLHAPISCRQSELCKRPEHFLIHVTALLK